MRVTPASAKSNRSLVCVRCGVDYRLANLELWSSAQPSGQRVEDKVEFALEMLRLYAPDLLARDDRSGAA